MAKEVKLPAKKSKLEQLTAIGIHLQEKIGFDPPLKTKGKTEAELEKLVTEAAAQVDLEQDEVSEEIQKAMAELGIPIGGGQVTVEEEEEEEEETAAEEATVSKKAKKKATPAKKAAENGEGKPKLSTKEKIEFFGPLIESGGYTVKDLVAKSLEKFPGLSESSVRTFLVDSKNAKYNKFPKLVQADEEGKLTFAKK